MELVPSPPLPAPELPARKTYKHPFLIRTGYALAWAFASGAITGGIGWSILVSGQPAFVPFIVGMTVVAFVAIFALTFFIDYSKPTVTLEEMWFRQRLDQARHCDTRVAQLKADNALLSAAAESLYQSLGKEGFAKLKDIDIINHAVELARKKTVD